MVSKKTLAIFLAVTFVMTSVSTFTLSSALQVSTGDKVIITKDQYQHYKELEDEFADVVQLQNIVQKEFYLDTKDVDFKTGLKRSLFQSLSDPYSIYMNKEEYTSFNEMNEGSYGGIGVIVSPGEDGLITVVSPIEETPGEKAGIQPGDKVIKVNGEEVYGEKIDEAVSKMKGDPGTDVVLTLLKKNQEQKDVTITRETIVIKVAKSEMLTGQIGYIKLNMFDEKAATEFNQHLKKMLSANAKGLIIDLRNNPGGSLSECVKIADVLLGEQVIVKTRDRAGNEEVEKSDASKVNIPMVVLVNKGSASASEILTGAMKDTKSGTIVGTTTFGKGLVQAVIGLKDGAGYKITVAQYFTPNGSYIHGKGIEPDVVVEMPEELAMQPNLPKEQDPQFQKALEIIKAQIM